MKICEQCRQEVGEEVAACPVCGAALPSPRTRVSEYRLVEFVQETHGSIAYKAEKEGERGPVFVRIFKPESGITPETAERLRRELDTLATLSGDHFVRHYSVQQSAEGEWYRVSEWLDAVPWGDLIASGYFLDFEKAFALFAVAAEALAELHDRGLLIPHLTLDDVIPVAAGDGVTVKIDYKLSRFINPQLRSPRPQLAALLAAHPDVLNDRPLDFRTDIWSLGRLFAMLVTDRDEAGTALRELENLAAPPRFKVLVRQMLEEDPELRPTSMREIAATLRGISKEEIAQSQKATQRPAAEPVTRKRFAWLLAAMLLLLVTGLTALFLQWRYGVFSRDASRLLSRHAERYRGAVAFVVTAFQVEVDGKPEVREIAEGTAFLVGKDGYLLTNRHVVCPWLENKQVEAALPKWKLTAHSIRLNYRILLWFDGQRAIKRQNEKLEWKNIDQALEDQYFVGDAFRSDRSPGVRIAGILAPPGDLRQALRSPLEDDAAFLKLERIPAGVQPIPIQALGPGQRLRALTPTVTLGFPLGSDQNLGENVVASATIGHLRRSFENVLQIDGSLLPGNSGGPVIDVDGRLLGIASAMAADESPAGLGGRPDFGLVLPAGRALPLLEALRRGDSKWNGVPSYNIERVRVEVGELARQGRWPQAVEIAEKASRENRDPQVLEILGAAQYGATRYVEARRAFDRAVSEMPDNPFPRFMRFALDWAQGTDAAPQDPVLRDAAWDSPGEFYGFLSRVLTGQIEERDAADAWENGAEKPLIAWAIAKRKIKAGRSSEAAAWLESAVSESGPDTPERLLALADVWAISKDPSVRGIPAGGGPRERAKQISRSGVLRYVMSLKLGGLNEEKQLEQLADWYAADPDNQSLLLEIAFRHAWASDWGAALKYTETYLSRKHRICANSLAAELLRAELLLLCGRRGEAEAALLELASSKNRPWYPSIARALLHSELGGRLLEEAQNDPARLVTLGTALGLWAEAAGDRESAVRHYRSALESYLSKWFEYRLAQRRIRRLRETP